MVPSLVLGELLTLHVFAPGRGLEGAKNVYGLGVPKDQDGKGGVIPGCGFPA